MACFWISLVGTQTDCGSDEFWLNASGELVDGGILPYWTSALTMYRMTVVRGPGGEMLSHEPSLSTIPPVTDWTPSGVPGDYVPEISGGPSESYPLGNEWSMLSPFTQSGILKIQGAGSGTYTVFTFGADVYTDISFEVLWA